MKTVTPVADKTEVFQRIREAWPALTALGVRRVGLFGSFVRGEQRDESDVDLLVTFDPDLKTFDNYMTTFDVLEEAFGRRVEIATPEYLSRHIGPYILREVEYVEAAG
jgi:uncharacterized protein